ncbi:MAG: thioredoxin fold domain-containing protein [Rhizobiaceae bacterium]
MKNLFKFLLLLTALTAISLPAKAAQLLMLEQDGCPYCDRWKADIGVFYHKTSEGKRAPLRLIDIHDKLPDDLEGLKLGRYTPTFVLMDKGKEVGRLRGYISEDFFWGLLGQMMKKIPNETTPVGG